MGDVKFLLASGFGVLLLLFLISVCVGKYLKSLHKYYPKIEENYKDRLDTEERGG